MNYLDNILSLMSESDIHRLKRIWEPTVVGVPCEDARRDLCVMPDGELRAYGWAEQTKLCDNSDAKRVYRYSRNGGLDWTMRYCDSHEAMGAATRLPSGRWVTVVPVTKEGTFALLSRIGPDDDAPRRVKISNDVMGDIFQPKLLSTGRMIVTAQHVVNGNYSPMVLLSDDEGESWTVVRLKSTPKHEVVYPHLGTRWQNNGSEPNVCELPDGRLMLVARTSLDFLYVYYSSDKGESWTDGEPSPFHCTLTTPFFLNLSDGRILLLWNNTRPLAEVNHERTWPPVGAGVKAGVGEDVFTNRDANHAAISSDGVHWVGCRELGLNEIRNAADFRVKGGRISSNDKSVHQFQAIELPMNKILVSYGQHEISRKMVIFDLGWLLERERTEDFQLGLKNMSTHLFVKSLSDCHTGKGYAGHCAWNRTNGALLMPDPDCTGAEALQIARVHDERLVSELQGAVWNFPASDAGEIKLQIRVEGSGIRVRLCDHWMNAGDEHVGLYANYDFMLDARVLEPGMWHEVTIAFGEGMAAVSAGEALLFRVPMKNPAPLGVSYLHMQTMAQDSDFRGTLIRRIEYKAK